MNGIALFGVMNQSLNFLEVMVWRRPHERYDVDCLIPTMKSGQDGVMVWGCFTKDGLGPLIR